MNIEHKVYEPQKEVLSVEQLDHLLFLTLKALKDKPVEERSAVVAGVYDPQSGNFFIGFATNTNTEEGYGKWNHAEFEAMSLAKENGVDLSLTTIVTSLGPCLIDSVSRAHKSCTENILEAGIKRVHIGVLDQRQADVDFYENAGLNTTVTNDPILTKVCAGLNNYFSPEREERLLGLSKAEYLDEVIKFLPEERNN